MVAGRRCIAVYFADRSIWLRWSDGATEKFGDLPPGWPPDRFVRALAVADGDVAVGSVVADQAAARSMDAVDEPEPEEDAAESLDAAFAALMRQVDLLSVEVRLSRRPATSDAGAMEVQSLELLREAVRFYRKARTRAS